MNTFASGILRILSGAKGKVDYGTRGGMGCITGAINYCKRQLPGRSCTHNVCFRDQKGGE